MTTPTVAEALEYADKTKSTWEVDKCVLVLAAELRAARATVEKQREALEEIKTDAHCIAKAGPLSVPTLDVAWNRFMHISVRAASALHRPQAPALTDAVTDAQKHNHEKPLQLD